MSYWIDASQQYSGSQTQRDFYCDTPDDIANLPTNLAPGVQQGEDTVSCQIVSPGSSCMCLSPATLYFLNSEGRWVDGKKEG